jgi:hypothetical protein
MPWVGLFLLLLLALVVGALFLRRWRSRRREREAKRREYRELLRQIRAALDDFESATDFDDAIRLLADIGRHCARGRRLFPEHAEIMDIDRACEDERRQRVQAWVVAESLRLMRFVEESSNLRSKAGRADQVAECIKVASRYLFPHEKITNAMRSVVQYQEAMEALLELPDDKRQLALDGLQSLLDPYFRIMEELKRDNAELARRPWRGEHVREILARLEKI